LDHSTNAVGSEEQRIRVLRCLLENVLTGQLVPELKGNGRCLWPRRRFRSLRSFVFNNTAGDTHPKQKQHGSQQQRPGDRNERLDVPVFCGQHDLAALGTDDRRGEKLCGYSKRMTTARAVADLVHGSLFALEFNHA
jgi:hypothetical protein